MGGTARTLDVIGKITNGKITKGKIDVGEGIISRVSLFTRTRDSAADCIRKESV